MEYIIKVARLGSRATVDAIATGNDKRTSFDITVADYVSASNLPATPVAEGSQVTDESKKMIENIFISVGRLSDLGSLLKLKVIQKLAPSIQKEGYEEESSTATTAGTSRQRDRDDSNLRDPERPSYDPFRDPLRHDPPARPYPFNDPNMPARNPYPPGLQPPGFEDEYDILRAPGPRGPPRNPLSIGHDDLYPPGMGPRDPIYGGGVGPFRGGGGGGGMHPTFDDPLFGGGGGPGAGGRRGDPMAPDGARYDPVGPGDPRGGPRGFPGAGHRGPGGAPHNPFGGFGDGDFM